MVKDYIKVPVVIQAVKWDGLNKEEIENFVGKDLAIEQESDAAYQVGMYPPIFSLIIPTLEGDMRAKAGDYIIKGVNGEFYPCKPYIFKKTYEEVKYGEE